MVIDRPVNTPEAWSARAEIPEPWLACGWSQESQAARFDQALWALDPKPGERILDYGCGTGELSEWVQDTVGYVGYDSAPGMVLRAARDHYAPHRTFTPLAPPPMYRFDVVACIGTFNLSDHWSKQKTWHTIRHLWDTTGCRAIAVCLYSGEDKSCLRYGSEEIEQCGRTLSATDRALVEVLPNDTMLVVYR